MGNAVQSQVSQSATQQLAEWASGRPCKAEVEAVNDMGTRSAQLHTCGYARCTCLPWPCLGIPSCLSCGRPLYLPPPPFAHSSPSCRYRKPRFTTPGAHLSMTDLPGARPKKSFSSVSLKSVASMYTTRVKGTWCAWNKWNKWNKQRCGEEGHVHTRIAACERLCMSQIQGHTPVCATCCSCSAASV